MFLYWVTNDDSIILWVSDDGCFRVCSVFFPILFFLGEGIVQSFVFSRDSSVVKKTVSFHFLFKVSPKSTSILFPNDVAPFLPSPFSCFHSNSFFTSCLIPFLKPFSNTVRICSFIKHPIDSQNVNTGHVNET